jgi:hypothetical protein
MITNSMMTIAFLMKTKKIPNSLLLPLLLFPLPLLLLCIPGVLYQVMDEGNLTQKYNPGTSEMLNI